MSKLQTCDACKKPDSYCEFVTFESAEKKTTVWFCDVCMAESRRVWADFFETRKKLHSETSETSGPPEMTNESTMHFGMHQGKKLKDVPAQYLLWVADQLWAEKYPRLLRYINRNRQGLEDEVAENERD